jgi:sugar phosphate isomerase/epimerase
MKLGITVSTFPTSFGPIVYRGGQLDDTLRQVRDLGYTGVDLFVDATATARAESIRRGFQAVGMEVAMMLAIALAEKGVSLSTTDAEKRQWSIKEFLGQLENAPRLGAARMALGFIRGRLEDGDTLKANADRLADSLGQILPRAEALGVTICLEPINRYEMNTFNDVASSLAFVRRIGSGNLKLLLDAFHMNIEDASIEGSIRAAGSHIGHFHSPDSNRRAPGWGHLDYDAIIPALHDAGYDDYLMLEAFPEPDADSCARQGAAFLGRYL